MRWAFSEGRPHLSCRGCRTAGCTGQAHNRCSEEDDRQRNDQRGNRELQDAQNEEMSGRTQVPFRPHHDLEPGREKGCKEVDALLANVE